MHGKLSEPTTTIDVELREVTKRFGAVIAVGGVSLQIRGSEFFSLLGPSGCGKTTIMRMIAGFETPTLGELWHLTRLADWLRANNRSRFLLTAPPLRLPGAVGSPVTPVATV